MAISVWIDEAVLKEKAKTEARWVTKQFFVQASPRPVHRFPAVNNIVIRYLESGYKADDVLAALLKSNPIVSINAVGLQLKRAEEQQAKRMQAWDAVQAAFDRDRQRGLL